LSEGGRWASRAEHPRQQSRRAASLQALLVNRRQRLVLNANGNHYTDGGAFGR
jgi:hypothetical protein